MFASGRPFRGSLIFVGNISDLYCKPMTIVKDNSRVINKLEASLTDDARVVIYNHHMSIVQAKGVYHRVEYLKSALTCSQTLDYDGNACLEQTH